MRYLLAIFLPPVAVLLCAKEMEASIAEADAFIKTIVK